MSTPLSPPIHLFRAILREASYLPDVASRKFHAKHVALAFRRHRAVLSKKDEDVVLLPSKAESYQMKRARKYLYMLQRANQGYSKPIENVLKMTYARKGKRRRELVQDLMVQDSAENKPQSALSEQDSKSSWQPPFKFTLLLRKQNKVQHHLDNRKIKPLPKAPALNRWNKPFPKVRAEKMVKKWYARNAAIIQAPLPEAEWIAIYRKAMGELGVSTKLVQKRRLLASVCVFATEDDHRHAFKDEVEFIGRTSTQRGPPQLSRRVRSVLGNPHKLTRRFLRRTIQRTVLRASPTVIADVETGRLAPRWDLGAKPQYQPKAATTSQNLSMFD